MLLGGHGGQDMELQVNCRSSLALMICEQLYIVFEPNKQSRFYIYV